MKPSRNHLLRHSGTGLVFLAVLLLQANLVYACEVMGGMPRDTCCCEEMAVNRCAEGHNHGPAEAIEADGPCCRVSVAPRDGASLAKANAAVPAAKLFLKTFPPTFLIPAPESTPPVRKTGVPFAANADSAELSGSETYLLTQRLRE